MGVTPQLYLVQRVDLDQYSKYCLNMKLLVALALLGLACAAPDADAWRGYYRGYGYGYRPYGYGWYGKREAGDEAPASGPNPDAEAEPHYGYWSGYYGGYYRPYYYGKRQADEPAASGPNPDADADADAHGWGYYGGYYRPYYYGWYGKREADEPAASGPNPDADAHGYGYYGGYRYRPFYYGYGWGK